MATCGSRKRDIFVSLSGDLFLVLLSNTLFSRVYNSEINSINILKVAFEKPRHIFEEILWAELLKVLDKVRHDAFIPEFSVTIFANVPVIRISFIPASIFEAEELQKLCRLIGIKFNAYLKAHFLNWKFFTEYVVAGDSVLINIWYAELKEDYEPFMKRYRTSIKQKATHDFGTLQDEQLNKELKSVK